MGKIAAGGPQEIFPGALSGWSGMKRSSSMKRSFSVAACVVAVGLFAAATLVRNPAALQRPDAVVLALMRDASGLLLEDLSAAVEASARVIVIALDAGARDIGAAHAAGVRTAVAASPSALALALGAGLEAAGPRVIAVPTAG